MKKLFFNKKILIYFTLFSFSLISFVPVAFAQTQYQNPSQQNYSVPKTPSSVASNEQGQVLGACDIPILGDVACAIAGLPGELFKFIFGKIKDIILEIIKYLLLLIAQLFGFATDLAENGFSTIETCKYSGKESSVCENALASYKEYTKTVALRPSNNFNLIGFAWMGVAAAFKSIPAINPVDYLAFEFKNNILGIQTVSAQGIGTSTLSPQPIIETWQKMRNLAYIAMVLILVVIGFLVLFRFRLDPRTTITATMALPRVAIALILITFSFAIAGLFIDLIYVLVNLLTSYFNLQLDKLNPFNLFFATIPSSIFSTELWATAVALAVGGAATIVIPGIGAGGVLAGVALLLILIIMEIVVRLILFGIIVFIFITLLSRFVTLLILTIFSPLFFLWGALPGQEDTTSGWFRRMAVNAISFPAILLILSIGFEIIQLGTLQLPPPLWTGATSLLNFSTLAGYGVMFFATKIPALLEDALRATPSAHVARAGTGPGQIGRRVPLVGGMFR